MPALPNYTTAGAFNNPGSMRFNPRTGEQTFLDSLTNQWLPSAVMQGQNGAPTTLKLPTYVHPSPNMGSSTGSGTPTPAGAAGGMGLVGLSGQGLPTDRDAQSGYQWNPLTGAPVESEWSQNYAAMNNLLRTPPQYIRNNAFTPPALPNTTMTGMTGGFSGAMPVGMGGGVPSQAPTQRTRVYGPSFGTPLPGYSGRNS